MSNPTCPACGATDDGNGRVNLVSTADTVPLDHPSRCECGGKGCGCACHVHTRDNTTSDDDLELDRLKHENMALEHEAKDLRGQLDDVCRLLEAERAARQRAEIERDAARAELAATKAGADHLHTSLQRALADLAAQDRALTATANELRAERDEARGQLARVRATVLEELAKLGVVR